MCRLLVGKPEGKRSLGRPRRRLGSLRERDHWGDPDIDGGILRCIFRKWGVGVWTGSSWLRIGTVGGH
jgi:hypothetical protein